MAKVNAVMQIEELVPEGYDFDKDEIKDASKVQRIIIAAANAPEIEARTYGNGNIHFMLRCKGEDDTHGFTMDDIADFMLTPQKTIVNLFTGQDGSDESDWIFIGKDTVRDRLDSVARDFMDRFDFPKISLDEWLLENQDKITRDQYEEGYGILKSFKEYGGYA